MRHHFSCTRMLNIFTRTDHTKWQQRREATATLIHCWWDPTITQKKYLAATYKFNIHLQHDLAIFLLCSSPEKTRLSTKRLVHVLFSCIHDTPKLEISQVAINR